MKKLLLTLLIALGLTFATKAQESVASHVATHAFVQGGVSAGVDKVINENFEIGIQGGHNRISAVGQSFDTDSSIRQYLIGAKYTRSVKVLPNFDVLLSLAAKTSVRDVSAYVLEPGAGLDFQLGKGVSFITGVTSPVTQASAKSRTLTFAGNAGLKFDL